MGNGSSHKKPSEELPVDSSSDVEDDDINRATELSLAESRRKGKNVIDESSSLDEDEQLARALQESLNIDSPPHYQRGNMFNPASFQYTNLSHQRCDICKRTSSSSRHFKQNPFWMQTYCNKHLRDGTPRCCSCQRLEPRKSKYLSLDDGRKLCLECLNTAIMDTNECQPLYMDILHFYEGLNMRINQEVPMLLVQRSALNEAMAFERIASHNLPEVRGLCLTEEQIVRSISRRPRIGGNRIIGMETRPYRLVRRSEVTAILVIFGLPRLLTGSILAHELMHAWMRLNGYRDIPLPVEEGICQVLAHMWLDSETMSGTSSRGASKAMQAPFDRKIGEFSKLMIETDPSQVYGDGFRAANNAVHKHGLRQTLEHIRATKSLPY